MYKYTRGFLPLYCLDGDGGGGGDNSGGGDTAFVGSDGTFTEGWTNRDEFKADAGTLGRYKNVGELTKAHMELRRKSSVNPDSMVEIPSETSGDDVRTAWGKANGVPETVDGYAYDYSDEFATKLGKISDERMVSAKEFAHKELGLSPAKFQKLLDFYHTNLVTDSDSGLAQMEELTNKRFEDGTAMLKAAWLDGTDDRTAAALAHLQKYGEMAVKGADGEMVNPLEKLLEETPTLKQSPWLTMIMDNMAKGMGEATRKGGGDGGPPSADGINSQISEIRTRQAAIREANPVNFKGNPEFKELEGRLKTLYQKKPA